MQSPPQTTPPGQSRRPREPRLTPKTSWNAAFLMVLRWVVIIGGLVIIVDLGTQLMQQRMSAQDGGGDLDQANLISNVVLFSILGAVVARQTGVFYLAALAGLLASLLDGLVVVAATSLAPPPGERAPIYLYLLVNIGLGTIPATVSGFVSSLLERTQGPRPK
jgi:hypothetical protein